MLNLTVQNICTLTVLFWNIQLCCGEEDFRAICRSATNPLSGVFGNFKRNPLACARMCQENEACNYFATRGSTDCMMGFSTTPCEWDSAVGANWITFQKSGPLQVCNCNASMVPFRNSCYIFPTGTFTWDAGYAQCTNLSANMVEIEDLWENTFLTLEGLSRGYTKFWIGATDSLVEGTFVWNSGAPVTFTNWHGTEPNNSGNEDYIELYLPHGGTWNDHKMTIANPLVCEIQCL